MSLMELRDLTCEGRPHGEVMFIDTQEMAGLQLFGFGSISNFLGQRTGSRREDREESGIRVTRLRGHCWGLFSGANECTCGALLSMSGSRTACVRLSEDQQCVCPW